MNPRHYELLEQARRAMPENVKVELSGDTIVMQASPSALHQRNLSLLQRQFDAHCPAGYFASGNSDLASAATGTVRNPDLSYLPDAAVDLPQHDVPAELTLIAVEVVSPSNPENDWVGKLRDYPLMGIPLYLIVDARAKTATLFSDPAQGRYRRREEAAFGEPLAVPEPFGFTLDTSGLLPIVN